MKCVYCDNEAEYDSPKDFCKEHWDRWWSGCIELEGDESLNLSSEEAEKYYQETKREENERKS